MRWLLLVGALAAAACSSASASKDDLRARVAPTPASLSIRIWSPTIRVTRDVRLTLTVRSGNGRRSFVPRRVRRGLYRARVVFPSDGRWSWAVRSSGRTLARGTITVTTFDLPYDLAVAQDGTIFFLDRGRILRIGRGGERLQVHAHTPSTELVAMVRLADGTLFVTDFPGNRILRVSPTGAVSVVAPVPAPADLVADASGSTLWVASIAPGVGVVRVDVASGRVAPFSRPDNPHGIDRDADGSFIVQDGRSISRMNAETGALSRFADVDGIKLLVTPDRSVYAVVGDPRGGSVVRITPDGRVETIAGTGSLGPHSDGRALDAQILPSAVALAPDGSLLVTQVEPVAAIRRVDLAAGTITTVALGR